MSAAELTEVERLVNEAIWANTELCVHQMKYLDAINRGAMALFSEKYGDVVRVIEIPGVSMELCGGTHVRTTGQIGLFRIVSESGVAAGVRRVEAVTGPQAYARATQDRESLRGLASLLRTREENVVPRAAALVEESREIARQLERARAEGGGDRLGDLLDRATAVGGARVIASPVVVSDPEEARSIGDRLRERLGSGVAVLAASAGEKTSLFAVVTDDLIERGVRADQVIREVAALAGGKGGGRPHMAQAGVGAPELVPQALAQVPEVVRSLLAKAAE
jgi:alanyl-tRNA synthetase